MEKQTIHLKWLGFFFIGVTIKILGENLFAALATNYLVGYFNFLAEYIFVLYSILSLILFGIPFYFFYKKIHPQGFSFFLASKDKYKDALLGAAIAIVSVVVVAIVVIPLAGEENETIVKVKAMVTKLPLINILIAGTLIGGLIEEFFFRGHIITSLTMIKPDSKGLIIFSIFFSSFLFGLAHRSQGMLGLAFSGIHSLIYAYLFVKRKSLVSAIVAHALYDGLMAVYIKYWL